MRISGSNLDVVRHSMLDQMKDAARERQAAAQRAVADEKPELETSARNQERLVDKTLTRVVRQVRVETHIADVRRHQGSHSRNVHHELKQRHQAVVGRLSHTDSRASTAYLGTMMGLGYADQARFANRMADLQEDVRDVQNAEKEASDLAERYRRKYSDAPPAPVDPETAFDRYVKALKTG